MLQSLQNLKNFIVEHASCLTGLNCLTGQIFQLTLHKLLTFCWNSTCQNCCKQVRFIGLLTPSCFFFSLAHIFFIKLRLGLCDSYSNILTLLCLSHFDTISWNHCSFERYIYKQALIFWMIF